MNDSLTHLADCLKRPPRWKWFGTWSPDDEIWAVGPFASLELVMLEMVLSAAWREDKTLPLSFWVCLGRRNTRAEREADMMEDDCTWTIETDYAFQVTANVFGKEGGRTHDAPC